MQLSAYSDYAIRVLMQTALCRPERTTVAEVAETFGISRHHLVKVVHAPIRRSAIHPPGSAIR